MENELINEVLNQPASSQSVNSETPQTSSNNVNNSSLQNVQSRTPNSYVIPISNLYHPILTYSDLRKAYLKENYPACFVVFHLLFTILIGLFIISDQVFLMYKDVSFSNLGGGFISGSFLLITSLLTILTISCREYGLIVTTVIFHIISLFVVFGFQIVLSLIIISSDFTKCLGDLDTCNSDITFLALVAMVSMGICCCIMCLVFFIFIQVTVLNKAASLSSRIRNGFANPNFRY